MSLQVAERETVRMTIGTNYRRDVVIRELPQEEVDVLMKVIEITWNKNMPRMAPHLRTDFLSFLHEEGFLLACKWDGFGGLENLGGYLHKRLNFKSIEYMRDTHKQYVRFGQDPTMPLEGDKETYVWDTVAFAVEDNYLENNAEVHPFYSVLNARQATILKMYEEGYAVKDIEEAVGLASRTIRKEKQAIREIAREYFGEGTGNGYKNRGVGGHKGGKLR